MVMGMSRPQNHNARQVCFQRPQYQSKRFVQQQDTTDRRAVQNSQLRYSYTNDRNPNEAELVRGNANNGRPNNNTNVCGNLCWTEK